MSDVGPEKVFDYIKARLKSDRLEIEASLAREKADLARDEMQAVWRECKGAEPGVYSFKEFGRTCVVVAAGDYPALTRIVG
jgi:hypothetical protein